MSMNDTDARDMIQRCIEEISMLRQQAAALQPRADAFDTIFKILTLLPGQQRGMSEDIVWRLRKQLEDLQPKAEPVE